MALAESLERVLAELQDYELITEEGVQYSPRIVIEQAPDGTVTRLEVGLNVTLPFGHIDANTGDLIHETHTTTLVPSTATGEGPGFGNVFWYEDDDAMAHTAWAPRDLV